MKIFLLLAAVVLIIAFASYLKRNQQSASCPQCQSTNLRIADKQLKQLKQDEVAGYGIKLDVTLILETSYRCQNCDHTWKVTAPEK